MKKPVFLKKVKRVHLTGIKGVGMTALACCLQDLGIKTSGSDVEEIFVTDEILRQRKLPWKIGFLPEHLRSKPDLLITTGAHEGMNNPQVQTAQKMDIPVLTHAQALGKLMEEKEGISVCGVGGKTTTSSIIATILDSAHQNPGFCIGAASIEPLGVAGRYAGGKHFVTEADEYANSPGVDNRPRFSFQNPKVIVVTNIEHDHPDIYPALDQAKDAFLNFFNQLPADGILIANADNPNTMSVVKNLVGQTQTYGFTPTADWQIINSYYGQGQTIFSLQHQGMVVDQIKIFLPGRYNVLNASAAFAVGTFLGLPAAQIKKGLATFGGVKRRFEFIGEVNGVKLYDDYAHHPYEIREVLAAAKKWYPQNRLVVIFQPHSYSRTKALFGQFSQAFNLAQVLIISDIYRSAREEEDPQVSVAALVESISRHQANVIYQPKEEQVIRYLKKETRPGDIIFTIGAGNIFQWHQNILKSLQN
jgi:UDP-N-acetylmuramate--alanine ligase